MRKKFIVSALCLFIAILWILSFNAAPPPTPPSDIPDYEYAAPIVEKIWVQKLATPLVGGSNMAMRIKFYETDPALPTEMRIYYEDSQYIVFHDDGTEPDSISGDKIYGAFYTEDFTTFLNKMDEWEQNLINKGSFLNFTGHLGTKQTCLPTFDEVAFNNNQWVQVNAMIINGADCGTDLLKQNSLLITDLSVVEDSTRTFKLTDTGNTNPTGVWTFGQLMKNMAGSSVTPKNFIKSWLKHWMSDQVVNGDTVAKRIWAFKYVIEPWLAKAKDPSNTTTLDTSHWESIWNDASTTEANILKYAPFKLMAIVNRLDLRGNHSYANGITNAGETRFVFTLISTFSQTGGPPYDFTEGYPPINADQLKGTFKDFKDWIGMNVIFEYGNTQTTRCAIRNFAQAWLDLSQYTSFPNSNFNDDLEAITNTVTALNAAPLRPNGSAINRIRTNERLFFPTDGANPSWSVSDWELRQFEIDATSGLLKQVPVSNTPVNQTNAAPNLRLNDGINATYVYDAYFPTTTKQERLIDWVFSGSVVKTMLYNGTHRMPEKHPGATDYLLAGSAIVNAEYVHHWDLNWYVTTTHYSPSTVSLTNNPYEKQMLRQLSLNTCQGCHTGETKTIFTQIRPLAYGESANYWGTIPDYVSGFMDTRFSKNVGTTTLSSGSVDNYPVPSASRYFVKVSAFLTGRDYKGNNNYQDDFVDASEDSSDATMEGLYYVYDPINQGSSATYPGPQIIRWGYNDLERRKKDLCLLVNRLCSGSTGASVSERIWPSVMKPALKE